MNDLDGAVRANERGMVLNAGDANVIANRALICAYEGRIAEGRNLFTQAHKLEPLPPLWFGEFGAVLAFAEGQYEEAAAGVEPIPECAWDIMYALSCYGHLGRREKAAEVFRRLIKQGTAIDFMYGADCEAFRDPEPRERLIAGLHKALAWQRT